MTTIKTIQEILGVDADGVFGPRSQARIIAVDATTKKQVQALLGVEQDGEWGVKSQAALNALTSDSTQPFACDASSFADPADLVKFKECKATGKSDLFCFSKGDNGIGQFGKITAQDKIPMIAVHRDAMVQRWGSVNGAAHRPVIVYANGKSVQATVEDRISAQGRIDLNPAAAKLLGLKPPFVVPCKWKWA